MDSAALPHPTVAASGDARFLTYLFYGLIGTAAALALALAFYWNLRLNASITSLVMNFWGTPWYFWPYVVLTLGTIILFGVNAALFVYRWRRFGPPRLRGQGSTAAGVFVGLAASACPLCGATLLAAVGIAGGLSAFPLQGLELKGLSLVLMALPAWLLQKDIRAAACDRNVCPIPRDASYKEKDQPWMALLLALIVILFGIGWSILRSDPIVAQAIAADGTKLADLSGEQCRVSP